MGTYAKAAMFLSIMIGISAGAEIVPTGEDCYTNEVELALQAISGSSPELSDLVATLTQIQGLRVEIQLVRGTAAILEVSEANLPDGTKSSLIKIGWDPDGVSGVPAWSFRGRMPDERYQDGVCLDMTAALAHELQHAYDLYVGFPSSEDDASGIWTSEIDAVHLENKYRKANGLCLRTTYGSSKVPGVPAATGKCAMTAPSCPTHQSICMTRAYTPCGPFDSGYYPACGKSSSQQPVACCPIIINGMSTSVCSPYKTSICSQQ
jgi:hypothetical protein